MSPVRADPGRPRAIALPKGAGALSKAARVSRSYCKNAPARMAGAFYFFRSRK